MPPLDVDDQDRRASPRVVVPRNPSFTETAFTRDRPRDGVAACAFEAGKRIARMRARSATRAARSAKSALSISAYDCRLVQHLEQHSGWNSEAQRTWQSSGRRVEAAEKRIARLRAHGFIDAKYRPTPRLDTALRELGVRQKSRAKVRGAFHTANRIERARQIGRSLSPEQQSTISMLACFRQMTPQQVARLGCNARSVRELREHGLVAEHSAIARGQSVKVLSLTEDRTRRGVSGLDVAKGMGLSHAVAGMQPDHAKILHDLSVVDGVFHARAKCESRGMTLVGVASEHMAYGLKEGPATDAGVRYADAYLTFRSSDGSDLETVAVEFGNYRPSYLRDKLASLDADRVFVYTHDAHRALAYADAIPKDGGARVEIFVIPSPVETEVER
jgi:hypothetical protein